MPAFNVLVFKQRRGRIFLVGGSSSGFGEAAARRQFHTGAKYPLHPFELSWDWRVSSSNGFCKLPRWRTECRAAGEAPALPLRVMVPCPSAAEAAKEALPKWGSWRSLCTRRGCRLRPSSLLQHLQILMKCSPTEIRCCTNGSQCAVQYSHSA